MNHRGIQRTLFRMQCDANFAGALFDGDESAWSTTGLGARERELILRASPAGLAADPGDTRKLQVLGNIATEFVLSIACAASHGDADLLEAFLASEEFHRAIAEEDRLPLAFTRYAAERAKSIASDALGGLVELESAMARARRFGGTPVELAPGSVQLAPGGELVRLRAGLAGYADSLRANLDSGLPAPGFRRLQGSEVVLVLPRAREHAFVLAELHVENLSPPVAQVLSAAARPLDAEARGALAVKLEASQEDLEAFVGELLAEGLLIGG